MILEKHRNISLIGFMGSGKSTIGKILADKTNKLFIDLDRIIELSEGISIKEIFKLYGEKYFRDIENKAIIKVISNNNCIFACGGGVVNRVDNMTILRKNSLIIYLEISVESALRRLKDLNDRPLINVNNRENVIRSLITKRKKLYRKYSDIIINCDREDADRLTDILSNKLKHHI